jgi:hypothetical protein
MCIVLLSKMLYKLCSRRKGIFTRYAVKCRLITCVHFYHVFYKSIGRKILIALLAVKKYIVFRERLHCCRYKV